MFKLLNFSGDDIRLDEKAVSENISGNCRRLGLYVEGLAAIDDSLTVICSDDPADGNRQYRLSPLGGESCRSDLLAELRNRYDHHFRTVGAFYLADGIWLLTEKYLDNKQ